MMRHVLGSRASIGGVLGSGRGAAAGGSNGLLTGLVAYWGLDEASGNALDKHGGGLTLTQTGNPGAGTGKVYGTARTFSGISQYFSRASETTLQAGNIDFALSAWVYLSAKSALYGIAGKFNTGVHREYLLYYDNAADRLMWICSPSGTGTGQGSVSANSFGAVPTTTWLHIAAWHDATADTLNISINNGTADSAAYLSSGVYAGNSSFLISGINNGALWNFPGRIGPVAFWKNRTLDATARSALWNGGAGLAYSAFS